MRLRSVARLWCKMRGVEELLQDGEGGGLDPAVAAPKIRRFCEEYLTLAGRLVASRLMLQLSPFMDSSVAGTSSAPTASTKGELIATKKKLDEVQHHSEIERWQYVTARKGFRIRLQRVHGGASAAFDGPYVLASGVFDRYMLVFTRLVVGYLYKWVDAVYCT